MQARLFGKKQKTDKINLSVNAANHLNRSGNLTMASVSLAGEMSKSLVDSLGRYLFMPVAALAAILTAIFAWRRASLDNFKVHSVARAVLETLVAGATVAALIGVLAFAAAFTVAAPAIAAATMGARALFSIGSAIYFKYKAENATSEVEKADYLAKVKTSAIDGVIGTIVTVALILLIVFAAPVVKAIAIAFGIAGSVMACSIALKRVNDLNKKSETEGLVQPSDKAQENNLDWRSSTNQIGKKVGMGYRHLEEEDVSESELIVGENVRVYASVLRDEHGFDKGMKYVRV